jgi:hypothetical protein
MKAKMTKFEERKEERQEERRRRFTDTGSMVGSAQKWLCKPAPDSPFGFGAGLRRRRMFRAG